MIQCLDSYLSSLIGVDLQCDDCWAGYFGKTVLLASRRHPIERVKILNN